MKADDLKRRLAELESEQTKLSHAANVLQSIERWARLGNSNEWVLTVNNERYFLSREEFDLLRDFRISRLKEELELL